MKGSETERDYYIDNLKAFLILFVVIGHFSLRFSWVDEIDHMMYLIYTFHMPCFVFVSGYLAKNGNRDGKLRVDKILSFLWLYLLFKLAMASVEAMFQKGFVLELFQDSQAPWYLFSLMVWYLLIPFIERIKPLWMIGGSIVLAVLVGYLDVVGTAYSMSRNFVFLPFFAMGFYLKKEHLKRFLENRKLRVISVIVMIAAAILYLTRIELLRPYLGIIYGGKGYWAVKGLPSIALGGVIRLGWYGVASVMSAAVMQLIPRKKSWFSAFGPRTLQIYILHILLRNVLAYSGFFEYFRQIPDPINVLIVWGGSVVITVVLGNPLFEKLFAILGGSRVFRKIIK